MPLTDLQAIQAILTPKNGAALKRAAEDNDRQRYHTGPATDEKDAGPYAAVIKTKVKRILNNDEKYARFESLLSYPLPSSRLVDKAADEYLKAFGAEDRFVDYEFSSDTVKQDASQFLDDIRFDDWLTKNLFNQCLRASAAVWIVDLPVVANEAGFAQPVILLREVGGLTDLYTNLRGDVEAIVYRLSDLKDVNDSFLAKRWAVMDDLSYRVYIQYESQEKPFQQTINFHELNRCPAGWIWHDRLDEKQPLRIQSPLHALFTDLDKLVIGDVFRQHADLYASFPILWSYKSRCKYEDHHGNQCQNGVINITVQDKNTQETTYKTVPCPACAKRKPVGPGSHLEPPQPQGPESADLREPAGFINAERTLLDYNAEKLESLKMDILEGLTGDSNNVDQTKDAVNEDQVAARFEARKAILSYWASHLQQTHQECLSCVFGLRYGPAFLSLVVDYGTEFHLLSPAQAIADYKAARDASLPMYQMAVRRTRIDKLLAGANESQMTRFFLLSQLEPYPDLPLALVPSGSDAWELKANFDQYITQFEREYLGLEIFGRGQSLDVRISNITQILYDYVSKTKSRREVPEPTSGPGGNSAKPN